VKLPTPIGLKQEKGVIGEILRQLPPSVLAEAEKNSEPWPWLAKWVKGNPIQYWYRATAHDRDAECAKLENEGFKRTAVGVYSANANIRRKSKIRMGIREVRFYSHKYDPDQVFKCVVMDARWPDTFRKTFEAAASQRSAILRLVEIGRGGGSISQSYRLKMRDAQMSGNRKKAAHWANKVTASILQMEMGRQWLLEGNVRGLSAPKEIRREARRRYEKFYANDVRRLGRQKADQRWKGKGSPQTRMFKTETNSDRIALAMTTGWLSVGQKGFPAFCFMSDEVLAKVLGLTLPLPSLLLESSHGWKIVRTIRERIGLKKAEVLITGVKKNDDGQWAVLDRQEAEGGRFPAVVKVVPPKL
jgi:hypothetical protein